MVDLSIVFCMFTRGFFRLHRLEPPEFVQRKWSKCVAHPCGALTQDPKWWDHYPTRTRTSRARFLAVFSRSSNTFQRRQLGGPPEVLTKWEGSWWGNCLIMPIMLVSWKKGHLQICSSNIHPIFYCSDSSVCSGESQIIPNHRQPKNTQHHTPCRTPKYMESYQLETLIIQSCFWKSPTSISYQTEKNRQSKSRTKK